MPSAGEVEHFAYCAHNWWLARQGVEVDTAGARRGIAQHKEAGRAQQAMEHDQLEHRRAMTWFFRILGVAASGTFLTLELMFLRATNHHIILLATALVATAASASLLVLALLAERRYKSQVTAARLVPGRLASSDLAREAPLLADPAWGLTGRPDYVLDTPGGPVPVEVKTGKTPDRPHRSHALQLACYLRLLEANGRAPPYGLLNYPDGVFRVAWDGPLQEDLRQTLARMRQATADGQADRDHEHPGRCRGCARRDACGQRLA